MKHGLNGMKILLVEDQAEARAMMRNMLLEMGVNQIFEAPDGREALKFIDNAFDFIDLIICDWNMPAMSGVELLRQLRTVDPSMPFLMVTGRTDLESVIEAKSSGVTAYIRKPFSPKQLEAKLKIIIHKMAA
jgi:two-component system chemotaxis response regulator CheY